VKSEIPYKTMPTLPPTALPFYFLQKVDVEYDISTTFEKPASP
jgi:hypothetical protein